MNANLKAKWVEALRSGEYRQTVGRLRRREGSIYPGGFCCLGVLCDLQGMSWNLDCNVEDVPPDAHVPPQFNAGVAPHTQVDLAIQNDEGKTFAEIADYIEANL